VRGYADVIARQVGHMTALVNDLLDVSRVTRGMVQFERAPVDIGGVIASAAEQVHPLVESRQHTLMLEPAAMPLGAPLAVQGDRARLIQVVANLLANAAKYTPPGGRIVLDVQAHADTVRIRVSDNGSGIDTALLPHVFELFTQGARTPDRAQGGLGLGLALARTIVLAHGGTIRAESAGPGCGSVFTVELPLAERLGAAIPAADLGAEPAGSVPAERRLLRVLLVDDNQDAASTLASLLEAAGHHVAAMHDPASVLRDAARLAPDVFILDIGLPGMDGYALARRLRQMAAGAGALFVALTGYGQAGDRALSRQAGFDHHLVKPVDPAQLLELLERREAPPG
jgi:CheY-like chemotaxis protein